MIDNCTERITNIYPALPNCRYPEILIGYLCRMLKEILIQSVHAGAAEILRFFEGKFSVSQKEGLNNPVTEADHAAEKAIIAVIRNRYPDHFILTEESGKLGNPADITWIIDPIDGTVNFAHGIPVCCVSIGVEKNGEMILGAVYNPLMDELFVAEKGEGATLNGKAIRVSNTQKLSGACLATGFPYSYPTDGGPLPVFEKLIRAGVAVRRLGSAALDLCWVAAGRFDGYYEHSLNAWDSAAGYLIVEEAGGMVTDFAGNTYSPYQPQLLATNGIIHEELKNIISGSPLIR
jgi:myo-inositol-1(or 4)-monophosphatase